MEPRESVELIDRMTDEEFQSHALEALRRELGLYGFARFLRTYRAGHGDYSKDRHQWLDGMSVAEAAGESV